MARVRAVWTAITIAIAGASVGGPSASRAYAAPTPTLEPEVGGPGPEGDYLRLVHERIHRGWAEGFIGISSYKDLGPPTSQRSTELTIVIRWDGTVDRIQVTRSSGWMEFDDGAVNAVTFAAPFPPPVDMMADDGRVHLKWEFARNHRLCSGGEMLRPEYPLHVAMPDLVSRGQLGEVVRRITSELSEQGWTGEDPLAMFARQWLRRPNLSSELDTRAAAALALAGDREQVEVLRAALSLPQIAGIAAQALEKLGLDVGRLLSAMLAGDTPELHRRAVLASIRATPAALGSCSTCADVLAKAATDSSYSVDERIDAIAMLGTRAGDGGVIRQALGQAAKDPVVGVRGAALLALTPRRQGRVGVIRMAPLLHDPAPEIRAAGTAGVLRAGSNQGIDQLYLLARERDPRPLVAVASELGKMSSNKSLDVLRKLLKRTDESVRVAAVSALLNRRDAAARALLEPILQAARSDGSENPAIRELAIPGATPLELGTMSTDQRLGISVYRALLRADMRQEAGRWLLANLEELPPDQRIMALGEWIATPSRRLAATDHAGVRK